MSWLVMALGVLLVADFVGEIERVRVSVDECELVTDQLGRDGGGSDGRV